MKWNICLWYYFIIEFDIRICGFLWIVGVFLFFLRNNCECLLFEYFIFWDKIWNMNVKVILVIWSFNFKVRKVYGLVGLIFFKIIYIVYVILWFNLENIK